jgi:sec-independent protein translocase protein TatA
MFGMGWPELTLIFVVLLMLFGAKRLPEIGRSLGRAITSFKDGLKGGDNGESRPPEDPSKKI